ALGMVVSMELEERFSQTRDEYLADIKVSLAGLVAEQLWYDQTTSGPSSDLQAATMRAAQMVAYFGMGPSLLSYAAIPPQAYGGNALSSLLSDERFRGEVDLILERCREDVTELLRRKAHCVEALRDRLMVDEQLTGEEFAHLMHTLGEGRELEVITLRKPPRALGTLRPLAPPLGNGEAGTNGGAGAHDGSPSNGDVIRPSPSPWARPPTDGGTS
ncbi:MAG: hypothetical protein LC733_04770, partial [Actinobacteria bacterium]|nr:hypothetical protein [Actinomycetota bacterium]